MKYSSPISICNDSLSRLERSWPITMHPGDASLSRAFHGRIAGCRSLCNFVTSSIRPCNSVMTRNDPAASLETGRMRMHRCQGPSFLSSTTTILPPTSSASNDTEWDIIRFVVKVIERFGKMEFSQPILILCHRGIYLTLRFSLSSSPEIERKQGWNELLTKHAAGLKLGEKGMNNRWRNSKRGLILLPV